MAIPSLVDDLFAAYNAHDLTAVAALYTAGATHENVAMGDPQHGPKDIGAGLAYILSRFPDAHWTLRGHVDGPTCSAAWYRLTGTLQADFGPIPACGQELDCRGAMVLTYHGGRITSTSDYWDRYKFQRQMSSAGLAL
jgi:steroid delta-isomerase-like uncharacterized protein